MSVLIKKEVEWIRTLTKQTGHKHKDEHSVDCPLRTYSLPSKIHHHPLNSERRQPWANYILGINSSIQTCIPEYY